MKNVQLNGVSDLYANRVTSFVLDPDYLHQYNVLSQWYKNEFDRNNLKIIKDFK